MWPTGRWEKRKEKDNYLKLKRKYERKGVLGPSVGSYMGGSIISEGLLPGDSRWKLYLCSLKFSLYRILSNSSLARTLESSNILFIRV